MPPGQFPIPKMNHIAQLSRPKDNREFDQARCHLRASRAIRKAGHRNKAYRQNRAGWSHFPGDILERVSKSSTCAAQLFQVINDRVAIFLTPRQFLLVYQDLVWATFDTYAEAEHFCSQHDITRTRWV